MSTDIKLKHSSVAGKVPTTGDLVPGEVAINTKDVKAYIKDADGNIVQLAGGENPVNDDRYVKLDGGTDQQTITGTGALVAEGGIGSALSIISGNDATTAFQWGGDQGRFFAKNANETEWMFRAKTIQSMIGDNANDSGIFYDKNIGMTFILRDNGGDIRMSCDHEGLVARNVHIGEELGINIGTDNPHKPLEVHGDILIHPEFAYLCNCYYDGGWKFIDAAKESGYLQLAANGHLSLSYGAAGCRPCRTLQLRPDGAFSPESFYIGGSPARNTLELWKSTLSEKQLEQLEAGTLVAPANVSTPGDGEYARQWYYNQQDSETQAALDSGELEYPTHLAAATFTDTFALGDNSNINLKSNGLGDFKGGVKISGGDPAEIVNGLYYDATYDTFALTVNARPHTTFTRQFGVESKINLLTYDFASKFVGVVGTNAGQRVENMNIYNTSYSGPGGLIGNLTGFSADGSLSEFGEVVKGFNSRIYEHPSAEGYNFFSGGTAPNYLKGNTYIGGSHARNTFDLWKSTLTEEQLEQLRAETLVAPANVSIPGDGSFARSWYYDQQKAETQALLDSGELEYPRASGCCNLH